MLTRNQILSSSDIRQAPASSVLDDNPFDLFGHECGCVVETLDAEPRASAVTSPPAPHAPRDPGTVYAELWSRYREATAAFAAAMEGIREDESEARPIEYDYERAFAPNSSRHRNSEMSLRDAARAIVARLVRIAAARFTPPGVAKLDINQADYIERFVIEGPDRFERGADAEPLAFDPRAIWAALEDAFGGERGVEQSYRAAAATLVESFDLRAGVEVKQRRDGVVLPMRVYLDDFDRKHGKNVLCSSSRQNLTDMQSAMRTFATWAEDAGGLHGGMGLLGRLFGWMHNARVISRERIPLCDALYVVTYNTRFEFVMAPALAEKLQIFIGLYSGTNDTAQAY
jgi:hypothetical protein